MPITFSHSTKVQKFKTAYSLFLLSTIFLLLLHCSSTNKISSGEFVPGDEAAQDILSDPADVKTLETEAVPPPDAGEQDYYKIQVIAVSNYNSANAEKTAL